MPHLFVANDYTDIQKVLLDYFRHLDFFFLSLQNVKIVRKHSSPLASNSKTKK